MSLELYDNEFMDAPDQDSYTYGGKSGDHISIDEILGGSLFDNIRQNIYGGVDNEEDAKVLNETESEISFRSSAADHSDAASMVSAADHSDAASMVSAADHSDAASMVSAADHSDAASAADHHEVASVVSDDVRSIMMESDDNYSMISDKQESEGSIFNSEDNFMSDNEDHIMEQYDTPTHNNAYSQNNNTSNHDTYNHTSSYETAEKQESMFDTFMDSTIESDNENIMDQYDKKGYGGDDHEEDKIQKNNSQEVQFIHFDEDITIDYDEKDPIVETSSELVTNINKEHKIKRNIRHDKKRLSELKAQAQTHSSINLGGTNSFQHMAHTIADKFLQ